jgi:phage terminase small subunit
MKTLLEKSANQQENQALLSTDPARSEELMPSVEFQSFTPYMGLTLGSLTVQQERLVLYMARGMSIAAAGRAAGYTSYDGALEAAKRPSVVQALSFFREQMREEVKFTRTHAHQMYLDAYNAAATSTEMKNTVDSMVKLHGLASPDSATQINISVNTAQLERMSDEELLRLAGKDKQYLEPEAG